MLENETDFVYYLFSNASMNVFPNNKPQNFKVHLPQPLRLSGIWEVGLSSIQYPNNWNTVKKHNEFQIEFNYYVDQEFKNFKEIRSGTLQIQFPPGQYENIEEIISKLNNEINRKLVHLMSTIPFFHFHRTPLIEGRYATFSYSKTENNKIIFESNVNVTIKSTDKSQELWTILGFPKEDMIENQMVASKQPTLTMHFPSLFIYSPIIQYQGVGDSRAPLLALVPVKGRNHQYIYERFDKPLYLQLAQNYITDIEIAIKDDTGSDIPFLTGKVLMLLHFRRRA